MNELAKITNHPLVRIGVVVVVVILGIQYWKERKAAKEAEGTEA